ERPVRPNFRAHRPGPLIVAGGEIAPIVRDEIGAARFEMELSEQMPGRLGDELNTVPVFLREIAGGIEGAAGTRRVAPVEIHLPHSFRERIEWLAVGDRFEPAGRPTIDSLIIAIRNGHVHAGIPIGRRSEDDGIFSESEAPGVVIARANKLQRRAIGLETKDSLPEADFFATNGATKSGIADGSPNPVVESVAQVAGGSVGVAHAPAGEEHLALIGLVVAVCILEKLGFARVDNDDDAVRENKACRDTQLVGENRELVRPSV